MMEIWPICRSSKIVQKPISKPNYASAGHTSHRQAQLGGKLFLSVLFMAWCPPCWNLRQTFILDPGGGVRACPRVSARSPGYKNNTKTNIKSTFLVCDGYLVDMSYFKIIQKPI